MLSEIVGDVWGIVWGMVLRCVGEMWGKIKWGNCFRKVHSGKVGWGRKFSGHATLFLMVPKS